MTDSIKKAVSETTRRRQIQMLYNEQHHIIPKTIIKPITNTLEITKKASSNSNKLSKLDKEKEISRLETMMKEASNILDFEQAIVLRERIKELKGK